VGESGAHVNLDPTITPFIAKAQGHGSRQMCVTDRFGFPKSHKKRQKKYFGIQTGDIVRADVPKGKCQGLHTGRVMVRAKGNFVVSTASGNADINQKYCVVIHRADGYAYPKEIQNLAERRPQFLPSPSLTT